MVSNASSILWLESLHHHFYIKLSAFILALFSTKNTHSKFAKIFLKAAGKRRTLIRFSCILKYNFLQRSLLTEVKRSRRVIVAEL